MSWITEVSTLRELFGVKATACLEPDPDHLIRITVDGDGDLWLSQRDYGGDGDEIILSPAEARHIQRFLNDHLGDPE